MHISLLRAGALTGLLLALALILAAGRALAADAGDLDPSFGGDGIVELNLGDTAEFTDVTQDARRRIVAVGTVGQGLASKLLIARFMPTGAPDPTFGGGDGIVTHDDPLDADDHGLRGGGVLVQPDGKIVAAAGSTGTDAIWYVARLDEDGELDRSFANGDGYFSRTVTRDSNAGIGGILYDAGRIVVAGDVHTGAALMRLTAGGDRDGSFRGGGIFEDHYANGGRELTDIEQDGFGRLIVVGEAALGPDSHMVVARYFRDGARDLSFAGGDGESLPKFAPSPASSRGAGVVVRSDSSIVAAGFGDHDGGVFAIAGLTSTGADDNGFGNTGRLSLGFDFPYAEPADLAQAPDGKLIAVGTTDNATVYRLGVMRLQADGALDGSFGTGGKAVATDPANDLIPRAAIVQRDGKPVAVGGSWPIGIGDGRPLVVRFLAQDEPGQTPPITPVDPPVVRDPADTKAPRLRARGRRVQVGRRGVLRLAIPCPADERECTGKVALRTRSRKLAGKRFRTTGGQTARLRLKLSRKSLRALRAAGRLKVTAAIDGTDAAGNRASTTKRLTLVAPGV